MDSLYLRSRQTDDCNLTVEILELVCMGLWGWVFQWEMSTRLAFSCER